MDRDAVDHAHEQWLDAMQSNDPAALGRLVTEECLLMPPNAGHVLGPQAVVAWFDSVVRQVRTDRLAIIEREVTIAGELAVERGVFTWTVVPVGGGAPIEDRGNFVAVWRRQPDGSWKISRNIWNSMLPLPALTA